MKKTYAAKLLFQWNPLNKQRVRRVCEENIFTFEARGDKSALAKAKKIGKDKEFVDEIDGTKVAFEFVGVVELICLIDDDKEDGNESWYEIKERRTRGGSLEHLIPDEDELYVFKDIRSKGRLKVV